MEINGKKVVVIGGASGMGRATAELLAERGADVAVFDREGSDGKTVAEGHRRRVLSGRRHRLHRAPRRRCRPPSTSWAACTSR